MGTQTSSLYRGAERRDGPIRRTTVAQDRLRALLRANETVVQHLDLSTVLHTIVETAVTLVGAEYGALGVLAPDGRLERLIQHGLTQDEVTAIGKLPDGHRGVVGALSDDRRPIRLRHITDDPRSVGVPPGHPVVDSFLGVPVSVRDEAYGNLYLINKRAGAFSAEDEELVISLAVTAGSAIDNARLFAETQRRQSWAAATAEVTASLLSSGEGDALDLLASRVLALTSARLVCVIRESDDPSRLVVQTSCGEGEGSLRGRSFDSSGSIVAGVIDDGEPRLIDAPEDLQDHDTLGFVVGPTMAIPLIANGRSYGALVISRARDEEHFVISDLEMASDFAGRASIALQLAAAREDQQRMLLLEDRARIARDLHDHVIQQLFATGLELQSIAGTTTAAVAERIRDTTDHLDDAISQIRTVIFALSNERRNGAPTIRHRIIDIVNELMPRLPSAPQLEFAGPVDLVCTEAISHEVVAVVRETLTNVARHAHAGSVKVALAAADGDITIDVTDDGVGIRGTTRRSGLANLERRAVQRGGTFTVDSGGNGTRVTWRIPATDLPDGEHT